MELNLQGEAGKDGPPGISGSPGEQVKRFFGASATLDFQRKIFSFFFFSDVISLSLLGTARTKWRERRPRRSWGCCE